MSVGTFIQGFDELIAAMDAACQQLQLPAFAQIGNSSVVPQHMQYARFLSSADMRHHLALSSLVVCHAGFGIIGDAMRAERPVIAIPRHNLINSSAAPANNQLTVALRLQELYGIHVCTELNRLAQLIDEVQRRSHGQQNYELHCNIPDMLAGFLSQH